MKYNSFHHFFSVSLTTTVGSIRGRCRWTVSRIGRRSSGDMVWIRTSYASITWVVRSFVWQCYEAICEVEWWGRDSPPDHHLQPGWLWVGSWARIPQNGIWDGRVHSWNLLSLCSCRWDMRLMTVLSTTTIYTPLLSSPFGQCSANGSPSCHVSIHADILSCLFCTLLFICFFSCDHLALIIYCLAKHAKSVLDHIHNHIHW